jgi:hypothetical protein
LSLIALLLLSIVPRECELRESCDLVELNHFYDENARLVFDQDIFYDWSPHDGRYQVRAWRLVKCDGQIPVRDWQRGGYVTRWQEFEMPREVRSQSIRETWTQYDVELVERDFLAKESRRELRKPPSAVHSRP